MLDSHIRIITIFILDLFMFYILFTNNKQKFSVPCAVWRRLIKTKNSLVLQTSGVGFKLLIKQFNYLKRF
jgi:hypothetical protein